MTYAFQWYKAMAVSACLHMFLLAAAGYLASGLTGPAPQEILLELDLMNSVIEQPEKTPDPLLPANVARPEPAGPAPAKSEQSATPLSPRMPSGELSGTEPAIPATGHPSVAVGMQTGGTATAPSSGGSNANTNRGVIAAPGILTRVEPVYPQSARQDGLEGTVVLRIQVLSNGRPGEITISRSSGHSSLDNAGMAAARQWRFIPAKDLASGRTVACTITLPLSFRLQEAR
jgi:protein TonB